MNLIWEVEGLGKLEKTPHPQNRKHALFQSIGVRIPFVFIDYHGTAINLTEITIGRPDIFLKSVRSAKN
jgi:hypothetical protein